MFKKLIPVLGLLLILPLTKAKAAYEVESTIRDKTVTVLSTFTVAANTLSTSTIIISLSSTTWPHADRGAIHITNIQLTIDKVAASSGSVKLGVITYVDQSSGTATYFYDKSFQKNVSGTDNAINFNLDNANIHLDVAPDSSHGPVAGSTAYLLSNDKVSLSSTTFNKATNLNSPIAPLPPSLGDVVMTAVNNDFANAYNVIVEIMYDTHPR